MTDDATRNLKAPATAAASDRPERKIGRFVIDGELGQGGMGVVLAAHDPDLDRRVAIKLLHDDDDDEGGGSSSQARGRLMREAQAMARLRHPNVVTVHEAGVHDGRVYVAMEFVPGGNLRSWLEQRRLIGKVTDAPTATWEDVLTKFVPAGRGLAAAHAAGLVHRDFKPDNVMVDDEGRVLVTDFGLAGMHAGSPVGKAIAEVDPGAAPSASESTLVGGDAPAIVPVKERVRDVALGRGISSKSTLAQTLTRTGDVMGTPRYMSPEQHTASATDARTDQFAFCAALYEALFGVRAFAGDAYEVIRQHAIEGVLTAPRADRVVPERIAAAVRRGLRPEPDERWPSMDELLAELTPPPPAAPSRRPWWIGGAVGLVAIGAALAVWWSRDPPDPTAKQRAAERHAAACDCELFTVALPAGGTLIGADLQPTGQIALPRGDRVVEYHVDGTTYGYAVRSAGAGASRALTLPAPEIEDGYVFVPGGDVPIGDLENGGDLDERPVALVHLEPYLIARQGDAMVTYADALIQARAAHARLLTAAEWEWAARRGVAERMLTDRWEWTGTRHAPYPYTDDGRDDALAGGDTVEVRGGQLAECGGKGPCPGDPEDAPRPSRRLAGRRAAEAELRLGRTPASVPAPREVAVRVVDHTSRPDPHHEVTEAVVQPVDLAALHRFVVAWALLDDPPALQLQQAAAGEWCPVLRALTGAGIAADRVEVIPTTGDERVVVRWNPAPGYRGEPARCISSSSEVDVFDRICFDGDAPRPSSLATIRAAVATLRDNPALARVGIEVHVAPGTADALALSQRRADAVRAAMIAEGIAADRLIAHGHGDAEPIADAAPGAVAVHAKNALVGKADGGDACVPGPGGASDRVELKVLTPPG